MCYCVRQVHISCCVTNTTLFCTVEESHSFCPSSHQNMMEYKQHTLSQLPSTYSAAGQYWFLLQYNPSQLMESSEFPPSWTELVHFRIGHQFLQSHFILAFLWALSTGRLQEIPFSMFGLEGKTPMLVCFFIEDLSWWCLTSCVALLECFTTLWTI